MKKLLKILVLIAFVVAPMVTNAQSFFEALEDMDGVDVVVVTKDAFELISKFKNIKIDDNEGMKVFQMIQDLKEFNGFAINPKIGPSFTVNGGNDLPSIGPEFNILKNKFIYSLDYIGHDILAALIFNGPSQNQLGIMMGKYKGEKYFRIQYQAGINMFWGEFSNPGSSNPWIGGSSSSSSFFTVGAVSKVGFKYIPLKYLSIGIDFQINLNSVKTLYMPMFSIEIGKLRNAIESHNKK